ncbi:hypothetical protein KKE60_06975, partial [Patescibacteria group bacterium]|nr:hypothetical protein [Patescibacteria group bacterium]
MAVDAGLIVMWRGSLTPPPANWNLCDGTGVTPNLVDKFIRGTPGGGVVGALAGVDSHSAHTLTLAGTHSHTPSAHAAHNHGATYSGGSHSHGYLATPAWDYTTISSIAEGGHTHATSANGTAGAHAAITTDPNHNNHVIGAADQKPPYYELAFLQAAAGAEIVDGIIIIWTGTIDSPNTIPAGWILHAGILDQYVRGDDGGYTIGGNPTHLHTVGSVSHNHGGSISSTGTTHTHGSGSGNMPAHDHQSYVLGDIGGTTGKVLNTYALYTHTHTSAGTPGGAHSHTISSPTHAHTCEATANNPKHRLVAFIEASGATAIPTGGVLIWMTAAPPLGFEEVTELRSRLVRSVLNSTTNPDLVTDRGVDDHNHTEAGDSVAHKFGTDAEDHVIQNTTHTHTSAVMQQLGSHIHTVAANFGSAGSGASIYTNAYGGSHGHALAAGASGHVHTSADVPGHNHEPWGNFDSLPALVNVLFVRYIATLAYKDIPTRFQLTVQSFTDVATRFRLLQSFFVDVATRLRLSARNYVDTTTRFALQVAVDVATRFFLNARNYIDTATRFLLRVQGYVDVATRFTLWVRSYKDTATRFKLYVQNYQDVATRFRLWVRNYTDTATRFALQITVDVATRFKLIAQTFTDTATRFGLWVQNHTDVPTRFRLWAQTYLDIPTRFKLQVQNFIDTATRFRLWARDFVDIPTRFKLEVQNYTDIATRFLLTVGNYMDIPTRFSLQVQGFTDVALRFLLRVQDYKDIATRLKLIVQGYQDVATRAIVTVRSYQDIATRFILWVARDVATRFILHVQNYVDTATRFVLNARSYIDTATRFVLNARSYIDTATRFFLKLTAHGAAATRFFLYVPTWKELQIQKEIAAIEARIDGL